MVNCVFSIFWVHSLKILTLIYLSMLGALFCYSFRALVLPPPPRLPRPYGIGFLRLGNKTKVLVCSTQCCHMSLFSHFSSHSALCTSSASIPQTFLTLVKAHVWNPTVMHVIPRSFIVFLTDNSSDYFLKFRFLHNHLILRGT